MKKVSEYYFFLFILFLITSLLQLKFYNLNYNHFDTGIEIHDTFRFFSGDFNHLFSGHIKLIKILFLPFFYFDNIYLISFFYFVVQTFCILCPLLFFNENDIKFLYLINPITWNFLLGGFHYDYLLIPIFFFTFYFSKKNKNYDFLSLTFLLVKETFFIFPFILGICNYIETKQKRWIFLSISALVLKVIFFYLIYIKTNSLNNINIFSQSDLTSHIDQANIFFFILLFLYIFIFRIKKSKNYFPFLSILVLIIIYLYFSFHNQRLNIFSHYYLPFFVLFFCFYCPIKLKKFYYQKIGLIIICNIIFSISFISISFWKISQVKTYSFMSYIKNFNQDRVKDINFKNKKISISNSFLIPETLLAEKLKSFDSTTNLEEFDYVIISKKNISYGDQICFDEINCHIISEYNNQIKNLKKKYYESKDFKNYIIYKNFAHVD